MLTSFTHDARGNKSPPGQEPVFEGLAHWMMTATLNIISSAGFNLQIAWPTRSITATPLQSKPDDIEKQTSASTSSHKHTMTIQQSVTLVMNNAFFLILFPGWLLRNSPLKSMRSLQQASDEF